MKRGTPFAPFDTSRCVSAHIGQEQKLTGDEIINRHLAAVSAVTLLQV